MLNSLILLRAMNGIYEEDIVMAGNVYFDSRRTKKVKTKRLITLALAAALILSVSVAGYSTIYAVNNPKVAERVALEELEKWKELGLLSGNVTADKETAQVVEIKEHIGSEYWYGRFFPHRYDVRLHGGENNKYFCNLGVDTITGKITNASFEVKADADDIPVREIVSEEPEDPDHPEGEWKPVTYYLYDNYDDIFPLDMTVDRFCTLLAEYWGFTGYRLAETVDEAYYDAHWSAVEGNSLLKDMPTDNYYLTVFFEGDQNGAPMYVQLSQFVGRVYFGLGTGHLIG